MGAPGDPPVLIHAFNWKKLSVAAALAYRWDGRRSRLFFHTTPDSYDTGKLIVFLKPLKRELRGPGKHPSRIPASYAGASRFGGNLRPQRWEHGKRKAHMNHHVRLCVIAIRFRIGGAQLPRPHGTLCYGQVGQLVLTYSECPMGLM